MKPGAAIEACDVCSDFDAPGGPMPALADVSVSARAGEFVALVG